MNGKLTVWDDDVTHGLYEKQQAALKDLPPSLAALPIFDVPLRSYNVTGLSHVRACSRGKWLTGPLHLKR